MYVSVETVGLFLGAAKSRGVHFVFGGMTVWPKTRASLNGTAYALFASIRNWRIPCFEIFFASADLPTLPAVVPALQLLFQDSEKEEAVENVQQQGTAFDAELAAEMS